MPLTGHQGEHLEMAGRANGSSKKTKNGGEWGAGSQKQRLLKGIAAYYYIDMSVEHNVFRKQYVKAPIDLSMSHISKIWNVSY